MWGRTYERERRRYREAERRIEDAFINVAARFRQASQKTR
jgi:hypothetical protein